MNERPTSRRQATSAIAPICVVVAAILLLQVAYDVRLSDALLYLGYELAFVVAPGCAAYFALTARRVHPLRGLAIGWALGYVLEVLAFIGTAAVDARFLFYCYPPAVLAVAFLVMRSRRPTESERTSDESLPQRFSWAAAAVCIGALAYVGISIFAGAQIPGSSSVIYNQDVSWAISLAADAKNNWPLGDPNVAGEPMPYHYFVNVHLAAASQVTGIEVPLIFLRLYVLPLVVAVVLLLGAAGQLLLRSAYAGLIAAGLVFFVGEMQLDPRALDAIQLPFVGILFTYLIESPSFLFGVAIMVALIALIGERIGDRNGPASAGDWAVIGLLLIGAADAKVTILPQLGGALLLLAGWAWWRERRIPAAVWIAGGATLLVAALFYLIQYRGHSSGVGLDFTAGIELVDSMPAVTAIKDGLASALPSFPAQSTVLAVIAFPIGLLGLLAAPLIGLLWIIRRPRRRLDLEQAWLLALLLVGLLTLFTLGDPASNNQLYFTFYGLVAGCLLSAQGLRMGWLSVPELTDRARRRIVLAALGSVAFLVALVAVPLGLDVFTGQADLPSLFVLWYGALLAGLAAIYVVGSRVIGPTSWTGAVLVTTAVLAVGLADAPVDRVVPAMADPHERSSERAGLTTDLNAALEWVRDETPSDSVIAVDSPNPLRFEYAAFGERRIFLGGWAYSQRSREAGYGRVVAGEVNPFAGRLALNERAFDPADATASAELARLGVDYLLVDKVNGPGTDAAALAAAAGTTVFENPDAAVVRIATP